MGYNNNLCPFHVLRAVRPRHLHDEILGIRVFDKGKLNLTQWSDQLPLAACADDLITFIQSSGGGEAVPNAVNYYGANPDNIAGSSDSNVISETPSSHKLTGFYVYGDGDAVVTLTFTPNGGVATVLKWKLHNVERNGHVPFRNPIVLEDAAALILNVANSTSGAVDYHSMLEGEAV